MRQVVVDGNSERWLRKGFCWVYPNECVDTKGKAGRRRPGEPAQIRSKQGQVLGTALLDEGWIAARVYRHDGGPLDEAWLFGVLDRAQVLRQAVIGPDTDAYRLVHGENDGLPGLRVDWWGHVAVIIADTPAVAPLLDGVVHWLEDRFKPRAVFLCYRADARDDRDFSAVEPAAGLLLGHAPPGAVRVKERGLFMDVWPAEGPDVGLYCDMRDVRTWLEPTWGGTTVLNTFCYTGAFSVAAARAGAVHVVSVDLSKRVLDRAEGNFAANDLDPGEHAFLCEDTFRALDSLRRSGERFDRVVLDPPSFSRSDAGVWSAKQDYRRLVSAACRVLAPDGWLIAASNQGEVSPREFNGWVTEGIQKAQREAQRIASLGQAPDFPALVSFPEGRYLKVGVWRLVG